MNHVLELPPDEKRRLLIQLLQSRLRKAAPAFFRGRDTSLGFDRFVIPVKDLKPEVALDPAIRFNAPPVNIATTPQNIFLTGATGFLGAFLLHQLLQQTQARVHCLVRCADPEDGRMRIRKAQEKFFSENGWRASRIVPVSGDLSKAYFALPPREFEKLASVVDVVYHNGALVNLLYSYPQLKATNVVGTQEAIRLASLVRLKPFHNVSSVSACPLEDSSETQIVRERELEDSRGVLYGGYAQSKWVAEQLVIRARSLGLPVCIYRPGIIAGDSRTGAWSTSDATSRLIKVSVESRLTPDINAAMDMTPVDYVSSALVHLSSLKQAIGAIYHLANPKLVYAKDLISWMRCFGYPIHRVPYDDWRTQMANVTGQSETNASSLAPLFRTLGAADMPAWVANIQAAGYRSAVDTVIRSIGARYAAQSVQLDCQNAERDLAGASIICPPVDKKLFHIYLSYFVRVGYLNAPDQ